MNPLHIFSDESENYLVPLNKETGSFRMRLSMDDVFAKVWLVCRGGRRIPMRPEKKENGLCFYEAETDGVCGPLYYHFEINTDKTYYLGRFFCGETMDGMVPFAVLPALLVPEWAKGQVFYQIFPDRFRNGNPNNDVKTGEYEYHGIGKVVRETDWDALPAALDVTRFYGGDLQGIEEKLPYLKALGVDCLYLNPIFTAPSNHKYDTADYDHIDPHLSKPEDSDGYFSCFVESLHKLGMRVVLDGVFNHCGSDCRWTKDESCRDYFVYDDNGEKKTWWNIPTLPKLNYEGCPRLWEEILRIGKKWVGEPYCVDGWRLDVAPDLAETENTNHRFWKAFREEVRKASPDTLVLAETYQDPLPWLDDGEWDTIMNYEAFMDPVSFFFTGVDKHSDYCDMERKGNSGRFYEELSKKSAKLPFASLISAMNALDNHDHSRFITRTSGFVGRNSAPDAARLAAATDVALLRLAVCFQFTWPGAPCIYYGNETALEGLTDPDSRRTYPWGQEKWELIDYYTQAARLRRQHKSLKTGSVVPLDFSNGVAAYARVLGDEVIITALNMGQEQTLALDLAGLGLTRGRAIRLLYSDDGGYCVGRTEMPFFCGELCFVIKRRSAAVFCVINE